MVWTFTMLAPLAAAAILPVVHPGLSSATRGWIVVMGLGMTLAITWLVGRRLLGTLGTAFDVLLALREGDYGVRAHPRAGYDPLQPLLSDINALSDELRKARRKRSESSHFFATSLVALRDPVFVISPDDRVLLANAAARGLLAGGRTGVIGRSLDSLGLSKPLSTPDDGILAWHFPAASGRWAIRKAVWHSDGQENTFVMLHDLSATLGQEERRAWQRLIRVLSHELNNSLTPIGSLAHSLHGMLDENGPVPREELLLGLEVISRRATSLGRFLSGYGKLARLPPPKMQSFRLDLALRRLALLEERMVIDVRGADEVTVIGDEDQLDQAFLNLLRNAVEATLPNMGVVSLDWDCEGGRTRVVIEDDGPGLPESGGLFVPFFTTKASGSGIGLSLARLIVEAHAGTVDLENRSTAAGAVATVRLPLVGV